MPLSHNINPPLFLNLVIGVNLLLMSGTIASSLSPYFSKSVVLVSSLVVRTKKRDCEELPKVKGNKPSLELS